MISILIRSHQSFRPCHAPEKAVRMKATLYKLERDFSLEINLVLGFLTCRTERKIKCCCLSTLFMVHCYGRWVNLQCCVGAILGIKRAKTENFNINPHCNGCNYYRYFLWFKNLTPLGYFLKHRLNWFRLFDDSYLLITSGTSLFKLAFANLFTLS